jgi:hypothetical protein
VLGQVAEIVSGAQVGLGASPLPGHTRQAGRQRREPGRRQRRQRRLAPAPAPHPLPLGDAAGENRPILQETTQVLCHLSGRRIALFRLLGDRLQHNGLQVPGNGAVQFAGRRRLVVSHRPDQLRPVRLWKCRP